MYYIFLGVIFGIVFLVTISIVLFGVSHRSKNNRENVQELNQKARETFDAQGFVAEQIFVLDDSTTTETSNEDKKFFAINAAEKKIGFIDYENSKILIVNFGDILDFEVYENNVKGFSGANIGLGLSVFGAREETQCKDLRLIITLKNYANCNIVYDLIGNTFMNVGIAKESSVYKKVLASLQKVVSFLKIIKEENSKTGL